MYTQFVLYLILEKKLPHFYITGHDKNYVSWHYGMWRYKQNYDYDVTSICLWPVIWQKTPKCSIYDIVEILARLCTQLCSVLMKNRRKNFVQLCEK